MKNRSSEIVSAFRISPGICFSLTGTYFKTQSKLTHFIKTVFQNTKLWGLISGNTSLDLWSSVILDIGLKCTIEYLRKYIFKFCTRVAWPRPNFLKIVKMANNLQFRDFLQL